MEQEIKKKKKYRKYKQKHNYGKIALCNVNELHI